MSLIATVKSKYRKAGTGNLVYVYTVNGTAKEIAAFITARANERNIPEADVVKDEKSGLPLYHFTPSIENGRIATQKLNLAISHGGKVVVDDTNSDMAEQAEDRFLMRQELAKLRAARVFGKVSQMSTVSAPQAAVNVPESNDIFEKTAEDLQRELELTEGQGTEKLEG